MVYLCKCGRIKTGPPYKSSACKPWMCDRCASAKVGTKQVSRTRIEEARIRFRSIARVAKR